MKGPVGTIVEHTNTKRIGVIVSSGVTINANCSPVQFGEVVGAKWEECLDSELQVVKTTYTVSPEVLADAPDLVTALIARVGVVFVNYGSERYCVVVMKNGKLGLIPVRS